MAAAELQRRTSGRPGDQAAAAHDPKTEARSRMLGPYNIGPIIGKGGFGNVYKAMTQDPSSNGMGNFVAIKQVSLNMLATGDIGCIEMEITLLSKLKNKFIVKYIDSIRTEQHLNIVLEFVENGSIATVLKRFGAFHEGLTAIYTQQILKGVQYLHSQGVIHRDIKGANVLLTKHGRVKLADFGVATRLDEVDSKRRVVGTPYWMAPEIVEMSAPTPACDIWSVGSTVIEMITEQPPYSDLQPVSALYRIVSDEHPPLPEGISQQLTDFLMQCFDKDPGLRPKAEMLFEDVWLETHCRASRHIVSSLPHPSPAEVEEEDEEDVAEDDDEEEVDEDAEALARIMSTITSSKERPKIAQPKSVRALPQETDPAETPEVTGGEAVVEAEPEPAAQSLEDVEHFAAAHADSVLPPAKLRWTATEDEPSGTAMNTVERAVDTVGSGDDAGVHKHRYAFLDLYQRQTQIKKGNAPSLLGTVGTDTPSGQGGPQFFAEGELSPQTHAPSSFATTGPWEEILSPQRLRRSRAWAGGTSPRMLVSGFGDDTPTHSTPDVLPVFSGALRDSEAASHQREAAEIKQLLGSIRPFEEPGQLIAICQRLMQLLQVDSSNTDKTHIHLVTLHGAVPIVEMLQVTDPTLLRTVLKLVNQIIEDRTQDKARQAIVEKIIEMFAMVGLIPAAIKFSRPQHSFKLRREACDFIYSLCHSSTRSLQILITCGGLESLVDLVSHEYYENRELVFRALTSLWKILEDTTKSSQKSDFCRILAKHGLCVHLCVLIDTLASDYHELATEKLRLVVNLLLLFAKEGDAVVKVYMAKGPVLEGLIASLEFLPPDLAVQICKVFKWLAQEPSVLNMLENAGVVPVLVHFLRPRCADAVAEDGGTEEARDAASSSGGGAGAGDACAQCLRALFSLCKLSRPRQEQAALAGAVPLLQKLVEQRDDLRQYAFMMLRDMTSASLASRRMFWDQRGVAFLTRRLCDPDLEMQALEALVDWMGVREYHGKPDWRLRVETELLDGGEFLGHIVGIFKEKNFARMLDPLLKVVRVSEKTNAALAGCDEFLQELVWRLKAADRMSSIGVSVETVGSGGGRRPANQQSRGSTLPVPGSRGPTNSSRVPRRMTSSDQVTQQPGLRRLSSEPAAPQCDEVGVRKNLLRLLLLLCQGQLSQREELLARMCKDYRLRSLVHSVLLEEQRRQRVILTTIAQQLLDIFDRVAP